ncbi:MAG: alpha amylase C-terminal domain-containing protein, partial [Deltaproteobacteria bacterium]|nr:alpha amylase C-terminal domain-containing protein [Deltaproteobacteria bacterium]
WIDCNDASASVVSFIRKARSPEEIVLVVCNFTPVPRAHYKVGVPRGGLWRELLNSDAAEYGGSGTGNLGGVEAAPNSCHGRLYSPDLTLPPLAVLFLKNQL